ncbi:MAG: efflux RND transporter periplasmic adaptor subunit [Bacteroidaceae bacterium]|nr:efflux RND transporter periplasmic adaptor subunit [Bacteroidaceae bacterium]
MKSCVLHILAILLLLTSCASNNSEKETVSEVKKDSVLTVKRRTGEPIETMILCESTFNRELSGNGKVVAKRSAEMRFSSSEQIAHIWVRNGDKVCKGEKLAQLDLFALERSLAQAKDNFEQSKLDLQDVLIGRGYSLEAQASAPADEVELAKVKSGYNKALIAYELAENNLRKATLVAPFDGVVANLKAKENNQSSSDVFCMVIDDKNPEVEFSVLESELSLVKRGYPVYIQPFVNSTSEALIGSVSEINPIVENNGMVKVKAQVKNNGTLLQGMNVNILLRQPMEQALVIPKSAVVMRSGKPVVFIRVNGKAQWNYVQITAENSDSCVVAPRSKEYEGLSVGDSVIVSGNLNLAHETVLND